MRLIILNFTFNSQVHGHAFLTWFRRVVAKKLVLARIMHVTSTWYWICWLVFVLPNSIVDLMTFLRLLSYLWVTLRFNVRGKDCPGSLLTMTLRPKEWINPWGLLGPTKMLLHLMTLKTKFHSPMISQITSITQWFLRELLLCLHLHLLQVPALVA
jgi:hypothetical protein